MKCFHMTARSPYWSPKTVMVSQTNPLFSYVKKLLLFQDIYTAADHVSKRAILIRALKPPHDDLMINQLDQCRIQILR